LLECELADELDLLVAVVGELVHGDDRVQAEAADVLEVAAHVRRAPLELRETTVLVSAVVLERTYGRDEDDRARREVPDAADDVQELLHPHVRAEPALGDDVVAELLPHEVGDERVVAVRDVREGAAVDERRLALERLDEVRL